MTDEELTALLEEEDDFRLAIRGFTALEQMIDQAMEEALPGRWSGKIRTFGGFRSRLELAVGLALVAPQWTKALRELAALRNDFAHGTIEHLTRARVRRIAKPVEPMIVDFPHVLAKWEEVPPRMVLKDVLFIVHFAVRDLIQQNRDWRYQQHVAAVAAGDLPEKIMEQWRERGRPGDGEPPTTRGDSRPVDR